MENIVFEELLAPVYPFIKDTSNSLSGDSTKFKLSFLPFIVIDIIKGSKDLVKNGDRQST